MNKRKEALYARLSRYAAIETTSDPNGTNSPTTPGQTQLAKLLQVELNALEIRAELDEFGFLYAKLPGTPGYETLPVIGFLAHLDTSPAVSGKNVKTRLHKNYGGGDVPIDQNGAIVLSPDTSPALADHVGHDIVTASGDTLLGADNKAGISIIMTLLESLAAGTPHGPVAIAFTPDEEIGRGMSYFHVGRFGADYACTIDGSTKDTISFECFNADNFLITIRGRSIHPGTAKGQLANPVRIAADVIRQWPEDRLPESTEGYEGFVLFAEVQADEEHASIAGIVRDFELETFHQHCELLRSIVETARIKYPLAEINLSFSEQYRNMRAVIDEVPEFRSRILQAAESAGITPEIIPIRGGTDGARLSFMGIPCPNVFTGGTNFHARDEWVSLDAMASATTLLEKLVAPDANPELPARSP